MKIQRMGKMLPIHAALSVPLWASGPAVLGSFEERQMPDGPKMGYARAHAIDFDVYTRRRRQEACISVKRSPVSQFPVHRVAYHPYPSGSARKTPDHLGCQPCADIFIIRIIA
jgi:hypothetical protein